MSEQGVPPPKRTAEPLSAPAVDTQPVALLDAPYFVILHDDSEHSYDYVVVMLVTLCGMTIEDALRHAIEVDTDGVSIVACCARDEAENTAYQILRFGGDPWLGTSCSMKATVEPAHAQ